MADTNKFLNYEGLKHYNEKIKEYIADNSGSDISGDISCTSLTTSGDVTASGEISANGRYLSGCLYYSDTVHSDNPFGGNPFYIAKIDDAFYAADKRATVTLQYFNKETGEEETPSTIAWANRQVSALFDNNYDTSYVIIPPTHYAVITISSSSSNWIGAYQYGTLYCSFYNTSYNATVTGRVYCNYELHGIGWHEITWKDSKTWTSGKILEASQPLHNITQYEITITPTGDSDVTITELSMKLQRKNNQSSPIVTKFHAETLYHDLTAPGFIATGAIRAGTTINAEGAIVSASDITATGTINGKYLTIDNDYGNGITFNEDSIYIAGDGATSVPITLSTGSILTLSGLSGNLRFGNTSVSDNEIHTSVISADDIAGTSLAVSDNIDASGDINCSQIKASYLSIDSQGVGITSDDSNILISGDSSGHISVITGGVLDITGSPINLDGTVYIGSQILQDEYDEENDEYNLTLNGDPLVVKSQLPTIPSGGTFILVATLQDYYYNSKSFYLAGNEAAYAIIGKPMMICISDMSGNTSIETQTVYAYIPSGQETISTTSSPFRFDSVASFQTLPIQSYDLSIPQIQFDVSTIQEAFGGIFSDDTVIKLEIYAMT